MVNIMDACMRREPLLHILHHWLRIAYCTILKSQLRSSTVFHWIAWRS